MVLDAVLLVFFFFKQKTAYEMSISDWSSDVCSSDLLNHDPTDNAPLNLAALCQRCHMIHDADEHRRRRWLNAYRRRAVADLFAWFEARSIMANEGVPRDRKSVVSGKSVSVRVDLGGRRIIKKTKKTTTTRYRH